MSFKSQTGVCHKQYVKAALLIAAYVLGAAGLVTLAVPNTAYAYVDPSVMTYTIQALAGVAVALGAVAGVAFRRTRKAIFKIFKIDENRNKIVEPTVHRLDENDDAAQASAQQNEYFARIAEDKEGISSRKESALPLRKRILFGVIASCFFSFTLLFAAPIEMYSASQTDLLYSVFNVMPWLGIAAAVIALVMTLLLSCLRGRAYHIALALVFAVGVCCWVQTLLLNNGLPIADGSEVDWAAYSLENIVSLIVWVALIAACIVCLIKFPRVARYAMCGVCVALVIVQGTGVVSAVINRTPEKVFVTQEGINSISGNNNVIVFVLDTYDQRYLEQGIQKGYVTLDDLDGFTCYTDCSTPMCPTGYALPYLLTAELPSAQEDWVTYLQHRYERSSFLKTLASTGYSVRLYSTEMGIESISDNTTRQEIFNIAENVSNDNPTPLNVFGALTSMYQCACYRDFPWIVKPCFWFTTDSINASLAAETSTENSDNGLYLADDQAYYQSLTSNGLSVSDTLSGGAFTLIHLVGAHPPYEYDENGKYIEEEVSEEESESAAARQGAGVLKMVKTYLNELKRLGLYDGATVIITADHGVNNMVAEPEVVVSAPILLVKSAGASGTPCVLSNASVDMAQFHSTVLKAAGADVQGYEKTFAETNYEGKTRYFYQVVTDGTHDVQIVQYGINGRALDESAWRATGTVWDTYLGNRAAAQ